MFVLLVCNWIWFSVVFVCLVISKKVLYTDLFWLFQLVQPPASLEADEGTLVTAMKEAFRTKSYEPLRETIRFVIL